MAGNIENLRKIAVRYYSRPEIQEFLVKESKNREVVPMFLPNFKSSLFKGLKSKTEIKSLLSFGKRPDIIEYNNDIKSLALKNATSFHCSEEHWGNPLDLRTELSREELDKLRIGWDLILDIDCNVLDYSKVVAEVLCEALKFHNIKNFGIKFSGRSGFHIGISFKAFPPKINEIKIKDFFPEGPRLIASYLKEMIKKPLSKKLLASSSLEEIASKIKKSPEELIINGEFDPFKVVEIDTVLIASRHLFRIAYSLHEVTGLSSIVIRPDQINEFHLGWAMPFRVRPKPFLPPPKKDEAKELFVQALDWKSKKDKLLKEQKKLRKKFEEIKIDKVNEDFFPPCIKKILEGMKSDGRKRALFILLAFFKSLNLPQEIIEEMIGKWNEKNYKKLKQGYIQSQISWFSHKKSILPPNCKEYYENLVVCNPDELCSRVKNPLNYTLFRYNIQKRQKLTKRKTTKTSKMPDKKAKRF